MTLWLLTGLAFFAYCYAESKKRDKVRDIAAENKFNELILLIICMLLFTLAGPLFIVLGTILELRNKDNK